MLIDKLTEILYAYRGVRSDMTTDEAIDKILALFPDAVEYEKAEARRKEWINRCMRRVDDLIGCLQIAQTGQLRDYDFNQFEKKGYNSGRAGTHPNADDLD